MKGCLLLVLALAGTSCGQRGAIEWGAECSDGKDNDQDGRLDCDDPDCTDTPICKGRSDGGRDSRPPDRPTLPPDLRIDRAPPPPDKPPASSYGLPCNLSAQRGQLCADGKTRCIPGKASPTTGFCTYSCSGTGSCPAPASPSLAADCLYGYSGYTYCAFFCRLQNAPYDCPAGFGCFEHNPPLSYQKWCWPQ